MKKKIISAIATLALGAALVGGGTFAYFNDTDKINNKFAAGTLNLSVVPLETRCPVNFDLRNMKPGDVAKRVFVLDAAGSLAIKNVMFDMDASGFSTPVADSGMEGFLDQFEVQIFRVQNPETIPDNVDMGSLAANGVNLAISPITLGDLYRAKANPDPTINLENKILAAYLDATKKQINVAPTGISVNPEDKDGVYLQITFKDSGLNQNIYQGDAVSLTWNLVANQFNGTSVERCAQNGSILQNKQLGDSNGNYVPIKWDNFTSFMEDSANNIAPLTPGTDVPNDL